ncbi:MAG: metalloregulator ArsR/SmtB family transcription factor [Longimicrobiales bacterium]
MDAVLKALVEPHRRQILALIRESELPAGGIADSFRITRPAVSQHLAVLKQAGLVAERRAGTRRLYRLEPRALAGLEAFLEDLRNRRHAGSKNAGEARNGDAASLERISVEREIAIAADRESVWELLVDAGEATRWMGQNASFDLHVGGRYQVEVLPGLVAAGTFLEVEPPRRLVHTWGWDLANEGPVQPGSTVVVFDLLEAGDETRLRLSHRDLPGLDTAGSHSRGWAHYLARLAAVAEGNPPGPDPWAIDPERMRAELRPASAGSPAPRT